MENVSGSNVRLPGDDLSKVSSEDDKGEMIAPSRAADLAQETLSFKEESKLPESTASRKVDVVAVPTGETKKIKRVLRNSWLQVRNKDELIEDSGMLQAIKKCLEAKAALSSTQEKFTRSLCSYYGKDLSPETFDSKEY